MQSFPHSKQSSAAIKPVELINLERQLCNQMGIYKAMKTTVRLTCLSLLLAGIFSASTTMACTIGAWNGGVSGSPIADSPAAVSRVSGECAMKLAAPGSVKDTSPEAEPAAIIRFYVYAQLSAGTPVIFEAFSDDDATASLLTVSFDGTNFVFDAGADASSNVPGKSGWNLVELSWTGGDSMDYWVNADATVEAATGSVFAAAGTMESVILGTSETYTGTLTFDDYVSHRSNPVGPSDVCNADSIGDINLLDALEVVDEFFAAPDSPDLAIGSPDCDLSGTVNLLDALEIVDIFFGT